MADAAMCDTEDRPAQVPGQGRTPQPIDTFATPRVGTDECSTPNTPEPGGRFAAPRTPHRAWEFRSDVEEEYSERMPLLGESSRNIQPGKLSRGQLDDVLDYDQGDDGPFPFVDGEKFQYGMGAVIFLNCIMIGIETDHDDALLRLSEDVLLVVFVLELMARWWHIGGDFPSKSGNVIDILVVSTSVVDQWILRNSETNHMEEVMGMMRLLRIVRLVRLVKVVPPLYRLALGLIEAMSGMFWVLIFLAIMLYAVAIILTRLIGHTDRPSDADSDADDVVLMFQSVLGSMFVLFETMSCWSLMPLTALFNHMPVLRVAAVMLYIILAWALLAVMTGVVCEKMLAVVDHLSKDGEADEATAKEMFKDLFQKAGTAKAGFLSYNELETMLNMDEIKKSLQDKLFVNSDDMYELFTVCDKEETGEVSIDDLASELIPFKSPFTPKLIWQLQEDLAFEMSRIRTQLLGAINTRFDAFIARVQSPTRKIIAVTEQIQRISDVLSKPVSVGDVGRGFSKRITRQELYEMEKRLQKRIEDVGTAVERLHQLSKSSDRLKLRIASSQECPARMLSDVFNTLVSDLSGPEE